jgi:predicted TIM-barrel fold metal-dependent hydrolase
LNKEYSLFDTHFHIIDPRFPIVENNSYIPAPFTSQDYLARLDGIQTVGGAVVSGSFQAYDQTYLVDVLKELGPNYAGVIQLAPTVTENELVTLHQAGVRAVRINLERGGKEQLQCLEEMSRRVFEIVGWHVELYVDSTNLTDKYQKIISLPKVCIGHLGLLKLGFNTLLKLAGQGVHVKASGFGRVDFDVVAALKKLYSVNPKCLMFGTDLPSTRSPKPYHHSDLKLVSDAFECEAAGNIFYRNALEFYKIKSLPIIS